HQGQICLNTRKIIIQRGIYDEFLEKFTARTRTLPAGDPLDPATIIGPLVIVEPVDAPEDAVAVANRVRYGLTSSILAGDTYKAFELAPKLLHGIVNVNSPTVNDEIHAPMGGVRDSGWGRTGPDSLADFTDVIWINTTSSKREFPF